MKTVSPVIYQRLSIVALALTVCCLCVVVMYFWTLRSAFLLNQSRSTTHHDAMLLQFEELFHRSSASSSSSQTVVSTPHMKQFMRSIYGQSIDEVPLSKRKKRYITPFESSRTLSDDTEMIVSLPNLKNQSHHYFDYRGSLEHLSHVELIVPIRTSVNLSTVRITFHNPNISINRSLSIGERWMKINVTQYITAFPEQLSIESDENVSFSSGFLTMYFQRHVSSRTRRDLSSTSSTSGLASSSSTCQVHSYRLTFAEFNWTSWIVEPRSYEMNLCSGSCSVTSERLPYVTMQRLLHGLWPKTVYAPCCRPKRLSSTILLYYDGPNLILKRFENMRVVQCACS